MSRTRGPDPGSGIRQVAHVDPSVFVRSDETTTSRARSVRFARVAPLLALVALSPLLLQAAKRNIALNSNPGSGWHVFNDKAHGWRVEYPLRWRLQTFDRVHVGQGVLIANVQMEFIPPVNIGGYVTDQDSPWDVRLLPPMGIVLQYVYDPIGFPDWSLMHIDTKYSDDKFPLKLTAKAAPWLQDRYANVSLNQSTQAIFACNMRFTIRVWEGKLASSLDKQDLQRIVASITKPHC